MIRTLVSGLLLAALLAGCGSNVKVAAPTIPEPLLVQLPISVGLRMTEDFEHFVHEEKVYGREQWSIDLGRSNAALFEQLFAHMFADVTVVGPDDNPQSMPLDALVEASIDAFEFATPEQSNSDAYAVWIRYRLRVYDSEGELVSNWPVSAYGKSEATTLDLGGDDALRRAAVLAMRDAAALMIMKFDNVTRIGSLRNKAKAAATPVDTSASEGDEDSGMQTTALEATQDETG